MRLRYPNKDNGGKSLIFNGQVKVVYQREPKTRGNMPMFKRLWLIFVLVLVSMFFIAVDANAYPNPFSYTDSGLTLAQGLAPPVMDKTFIYDAKMASINTFTNYSWLDNGALTVNIANTTVGDRYQNVAINRLGAVFSGDMEVTHPADIVCESLATFGYFGLNIAKKNGQSIDYNNRSTLPEVVYIGNRSGPGDGEAYFAITCGSLVFLPDIGYHLYQNATSRIQSRSTTPEVVYLGKMLGAGDSDLRPKLGNEFAVVCVEDGC